MSIYIKNLVSVIIPTFRRAEKLERAINSVLAQSYKNIELLVVNDNEPSDEFTLKLNELISKYDDSRLFLIHQKKHINGAVARNVGIKNAKGEYVAFLDDDDYWSINKLEKQIKVLEKLDSSWGGVSCRKLQYNNDRFVKASLPYKSGKIFEKVLLRQVEVSTGTILLRREALDEAGYYDENLKRHQEVQLLTFFTYKYNLKLVNDFLHFADVSDNQNRPDVEQLKQVKTDFFVSVDPIMKKLPRKNQRRIYTMHQFELGYAYLKNKQYLEGIKKTLSVLKSPITVYYALERSLIRIIEVKFRNLISDRKK